MSAWKYQIQVRNKSGISAHPCIILYLSYGHGCFTANRNTLIFHIFTSEDMKKYVKREKRVCF